MATNTIYVKRYKQKLIPPQATALRNRLGNNSFIEFSPDNIAYYGGHTLEDLDRLWHRVTWNDAKISSKPSLYRIKAYGRNKVFGNLEKLSHYLKAVPEIMCKDLEIVSFDRQASIECLDVMAEIFENRCQAVFF